MALLLLGVTSARAEHVDPDFVSQNPSCSSLDYEFKIDPAGPTDGTEIFDDPNSSLVIMMSVTGDDRFFDWSSNFGIDAVVAKGGSDANVYTYVPPETSDTGLHAPANPNGQPAGLSHISFCFEEEGVPPSEICELDSDCDDSLECTVDSCVDNECVNTPASEGTACGSQSDDACDAPDTCDAQGTCVMNYKPSTEVCRGAAGVCDEAELCTGDSADCPADAKSSEVCRQSTGVCDPEEVCDGTNDECPADVLNGAETICRGSAGECDVEEVCDGVNGACPADFKSTDVCRAAAGVCDETEFCDGVADSCPTDAKKGGETTCRPVDGACDVAEVCDGAANDCPADEVAAGGTSCAGDAFSCTDDACDGVSKTCISIPDSTNCNDGEECTVDVCDPANSDMVSGCVFAFDSSASEDCVEVCRTAGFWGTHAGNDKGGKNVTGAVIGEAGGCLTVCGERIDTPSSVGDPAVVNVASSALEAMCVQVKGDPRLQLARQLTAAALSCVATGSTATCDGVSVDALFKACDSSCAGGSTVGTIDHDDDPGTDPVAFDCIEAIDCFNNGGNFDPLTGCQIGVCDDPTNTACGLDGLCPGGSTCIPLEGNCHDRPFADSANPEIVNLDLDHAGPASSAKDCNDANKSKCTSTPDGEAACANGGAGPETCSEE